MSINKSIHTIDLMLGIPEQEDRSDWYTFMEPLLRDEESKSMFKMPAQYMFKDIPETGSHDDFIQYTIEQMDKFYINQAMIGFHEKSEVKIEAAKTAPVIIPWKYDFILSSYSKSNNYIIINLLI